MPYILRDSQTTHIHSHKKFYNGTAKEEINRVSNVLYGYDRAMTNNYAPIFSDKNYVGSEPGKFDSTAEGVGHLKSRQYGTNPSYQISAFDAFERHTDQTARFVGYAIPVRNMNTLMNWRESGNRSMRKTISGKWGKQGGSEYIDNLLTNLRNTRYTETGAIDAGTNNLLSNYVSAVFGANPGIVFKQAASFPQAAAVLGYGTLPTKTQRRNIDTDLISKYTPELDYRLLGYATPETAAIKNNPGILDRNRVTRFLFRGGAITAMDGATVKRIWPWAENYVSKHFPNLEKGTQAEIDAGESQYYKKVAEVFNEAVGTTQPMYDTMHRAGIMQNSKGIARAFTMFKTVPLQQYNTLRKAFGELSATEKGSAERKAAARNAANAVTVTLASTVGLEAIEFLNQLWKNGAKGYRDDDDELTAGSAAEKFAKNAVNDLAGLVIGGKEFSSLLQTVFLKEKWYDIEMPGVEQLNDIIDDFQDAIKVINGLITDASDVVDSGGDLGEYFRRHGADYAGAVKDIAETLAMYIGGLLAENVEKYIVGAFRGRSPELYVAMQDFFSTPDRSNLKGLDGKALEQRVGDILKNRFGEMPKSAAKELSRLYGGYGSAVILPDTPPSVVVDGEEIKLDAAEQQRYDKAVWQAAKDALDGLDGDEQYQAMDDAARIQYIKKLYSGETEYAKLENVPGYAEANPSKAKKYDALKDAGLSAGEVVRGMALAATATSEKDENGETIDGSEKFNMMKLIDTLDISDEEKITLLAATGKSTDETMWNTAYKGDDYETYYYMSDSAKKNYLVYCSWMEAADFAKYYTVSLGFASDKDANGKGIAGSKKKKVLNYIDSLPLLDDQKTAMYAALCGPMGWSESKVSDCPWWREGALRASEYYPW